MTFSRITVSLLLALAVAMPSFADKAEKKRDKIRDMREEVLAELFKERPQTRAEIDVSEGYAVFSNVGVQVFLIGGGGGRGVVRDMKTGRDTFMKMGNASVGLGLGVKDFRSVFIFHDRDSLHDFVEKGWDFSGEADAAAKSNEKGGDLGEAAGFSKKVSIYQMTKTGLALQASLKGTKYWKDDKLNGE
ncbi:MAG: hypothetical protein HWE25_10495 [Alphaproteobacteria bacterium]|nr:hypothetical protein [Alphaproteobacteria bacterium]